MEARIGGESHHFFPGSSKGLGKKPQEWVSSEWKWDGDLFLATPVNPGPLECGKKKMFPDLSLSNSTSSNSDDVEFRNPREGLSLADKRRRIVVFDEDEHGDVAGNLTLKLGGHANGVIEEEQDTGEKKNCKRGMVQASNSNRSKCQVEGCGVDLCQSKDYHRRHKVCEMHAKASSAMVGNVIQRFCQQCSRFHLLQEFDEGKRSCRRRLAGHNKRRRKNNSDATPNGSAAADDQTMGYLLISLLRILANLNSDRSEQSKDQELLTNLLRNIASLSSPSNDNKSSGVQEASQGLHAVDTSAGTSRNVVATASLISGALPMTENFSALCPPSKTLSAAPMASNHMASANVAPSEIHFQRMCSGTSFSETLQLSGRLISEANVLPIKSCMLPTACTSDGVRTNGFDLNTVCDDEQEVLLGCQQPENPETLRVTSNCPPCMLKDIQQRSPPQTSGNTDSTSTRSPSSSNGDAQSRTDRIVFKLFGKGPSDFPLVLRTQIFDWLSHSPTDIESYIRPGCIVLTLYFRLGVSAWDELCYDLGSSLKRLLLLAADDFWRVGWIYATVQHNVAVIYNGQVVLNNSLMMGRYGCSTIVCVTPIAVPPSSRITFKVKVSNLPQCTRLYCAFEGEYIIEDTDQESVGYLDNGSMHEQFQFLNFSCVIPDAIGRGFVEVEENGLSSGFFPFIVAEEDVCAELRMLESSIDVASCDDLVEEEVESERSPCMTFLHEMGWLLRRCQLSSRREVQSSCLEPFSLVRFRWILRFAINHDWPAIVNKLLDILFEGNIDSGELCPTKVALSEDLLHYAVQRNSNSIVKFLLRYKPKKNSDRDLNLFKPDMRGPCNVTPLHVAAASSNAGAVLDLLTDDPGQLGVKAWQNSRDSTGFTPEDYARARGHESYIFMMQKKINRSTETCDVVLNMPAKTSFVSDSNHKQNEELKYGKQSGLEVEKSKAKLWQPPFCKLCERHLACRRSMGTSLIYRPMLLSMVGIAAVCVCVGLLLKGPPEVDFVYPPFRWELLDWGFM